MRRCVPTIFILCLTGLGTAALADEAASCAAGDPQSCLFLCEDQAAVCIEDSGSYNKGKCNDLTDSVPLCSDLGPADLGKLCRLRPQDVRPTQMAVGAFAAA